MQNLKSKGSVKKDSGIEETMEALDNYLKLKAEGKAPDYLIIHNPRWLGVTSATKELFENYLPMQEIFLNSNVEKLNSTVLPSKFKVIGCSSSTL